MTTAVTQTIISYGTCTTNNGCTGENDIDLYFDTVFDGRTDDNEFDLYIDTVFDARSSVSNDNDSDSFGHIL